MKTLVMAVLFAVMALHVVPSEANQQNKGHGSAEPQAVGATPVDQAPPASPSPAKEHNRVNRESNQTSWSEILIKPVLDNWPLTIVAIVGIIVANNTLKSIDKQVGLMDGQLNEMKSAGTR